MIVILQVPVVQRNILIPKYTYCLCELQSSYLPAVVIEILEGLENKKKKLMSVPLFVRPRLLKVKLVYVIINSTYDNKVSNSDSKATTSDSKVSNSDSNTSTSDGKISISDSKISTSYNKDNSSSDSKISTSKC